jgi:autotransporter translocation and assembly factor TamB
MARAARSHLSRFLRWALFLVLSLLLLLSLLFVSLRLSFAREQLRVRVNAALSQVFQGKIELDRIGTLTLWGVSGVDARVFDASGRQVIRVQGLSASASLPALGWQFLAHGDRPELLLTDVHVDHADVTLREDEELGVTLASAFLPREDGSESPPSAPGMGPRLRIERAGFAHIWAHGRVSGSPPLDAELARLVASLSYVPATGTNLELERAELVSRALPWQADPRGQVTGRVESPPADLGPLRLELTFHGRAAGSVLALEASWVGDEVYARVDASNLPSAFVNQHAPGLGLDGDLTVSAEVDGPLPQLDFVAELDSTAAHVKTAGYAVLTQGLEMSAVVEATRVDVARIADGAPSSQLAVQLRALLLEREDGQFVGSHRVDVRPGWLAGQATPALWVSGRDTLDSESGFATSGRLGAEDPGLSVQGDYQVTLPPERGGHVVFALRSQLDDPARLAALGLRARGRAELSADLLLAQRRLSAKAMLDLRHVDHAVVQARDVGLAAEVSGTFDNPRVHAAGRLDLVSRRQRGSVRFDACVERPTRFADYELDANANVDWGNIGSLVATAKDLQLPSLTTSLSRMARLKGELSARGKVDLEALSPLLTGAGLPIERTTGRVRFEVAAGQAESDGRGLTLSAALDTNGFRVVEKRTAPERIVTTAQAIDSQPRALEGIDVHVSMHAWPKSGDAVGTLILRDTGGTLAEVQGSVQLGKVWPQGLASSAALAAVPFEATLQVPRRRLQSLPPLLRPAALRGRVALDAHVVGSLADPRVEVQLSGQSLRALGSREPVDVNVAAVYENQGGKANVDAKLSRSSTEVASLNGTWQGDLRRAGELASGTSGLSASVSAKLVDFPLDVVPDIADRDIDGRISGDLKLDDWGRDARLDASFASTTLSLARVPVRELTAKINTDQAKLMAEVAMKVGGGASHATLDADMQWGKKPLPTLAHRGTAKLETRAFDLGTLGPLLGGYVSELGGMLDANTELAVTPESTRLSGSAQLERGVVQVPAIGQRFSDITARVAVADNQFKLEKLEARGTTGRLNVTGAAQLDGFDLRGARAHLAIRKNESIPITLEGAALGDAWGNIDASYSSPAKGERQLDIDVPELHLVTPETSGHGLQQLDQPRDIRVGVRRADGTFVALPLQPLEPGGEEANGSAKEAQPLRIRVKLGRNVTVARDRSAQVQLAGQLSIFTGPPTEVDGRIEVRGGKLDVQGKTFEVERGVVTFEGDDPSNPTITATARWDGPGYTVYADYLGDVKHGRIKLRAEPPLTQNEIASLLLFGSPEGSVGGGSDPNAAALAVGVAGGTAAKGLNQALDDFTNLDVSARIDTTTGSARPELVFQVSPRVSAKVTRAIGSPGALESPDRTFLTLELRLKRAWALSAIFGDHGGSTLDLIWRRRY